jgi:hypothetical protein
MKLIPICTFNFLPAASSLIKTIPQPCCPNLCPPLNSLIWASIYLRKGLTDVLNSVHAYSHYNSCSSRVDPWDWAAPVSSLFGKKRDQSIKRSYPTKKTCFESIAWVVIIFEPNCKKCYQLLYQIQNYEH